LKRAAMMAMVSLVPAFANAQNTDSRAITDLLKEAETHAVLAQDDAETLESYTRSKVGWQSHANRVNQIREHANELIDNFNKLNSMRGEASLWQQEAIDHVNPLLQEMSKHLTATINHLNENQSKLQMPPFPDYAKANREMMTATSKLISDYVHYGESKARADSLENNLGLPEVAHE
jgi:uncharacterized coiled-coil DUF342 family protein